MLLKKQEESEKQVLIIKDPLRLSIENIYKINEENLLSLDILTENGDVIQSNVSTLPHKATNYYYIHNTVKEIRGRPRATLPSTLQIGMQRTVEFKLTIN